MGLRGRCRNRNRLHDRSSLRSECFRRKGLGGRVHLCSGARSKVRHGGKRYNGNKDEGYRKGGRMMESKDKKEKEDEGQVDLERMASTLNETNNTVN